MIGPIEVDTFFTRLTKERNELHERVGKLREFVESMPFHKLNKKQQHWLRKQLIVMEEYLLILDERIADLLEQ